MGSNPTPVICLWNFVSQNSGKIQCIRHVGVRAKQNTDPRSLKTCETNITQSIGNQFAQKKFGKKYKVLFL